MRKRIFKVGKGRSGLRPDQLSSIDFQGGQDTGNQADQYGRQQHIASWIMNFLRKRGNAVKADVSQNRQSSATREGFPGESRRIVKWACQGSRVGGRMLKEIATGSIKEEQNHHAQTRGQDNIGASARFNAAQIQSGEEQGINNKPGLYGDAMKHAQIDCRLAAPD